MPDLTLADGDAVLTVAAEAGGRLAGLRVDGLDLIGRGGPGLFHWGCYVMAPYAGRIRRGQLRWQGRTHQLPVTFGPHAIHGVTVDRPWTVLDADARSARLGCALDSRWPWPGRVEAEYALTGDGLTARIALHASREPMPGWTGWHPWFARRLARGEPARIAFDADALLPRDPEGIPSGARAEVPAGPYDDCLDGVRWPASVSWDGALRLEVSSDAPCVVVYDERPDGVCVEPQTAPPDAVALDRHAVVEPGVPLEAVMRWTWAPS